MLYSYLFNIRNVCFLSSDPLLLLSYRLKALNKFFFIFLFTLLSLLRVEGQLTRKMKLFLERQFYYFTANDDDNQDNYFEGGEKRLAKQKKLILNKKMMMYLLPHCNIDFWIVE